MVHKNILNKIEVNFTFLMKIDINESFKRLKKRSNLNRYDQFNKNYYKNVQNGFIKLSNLQPQKYMIINSKNSITINKKIIFQKFLELIK